MYKIILIIFILFAMCFSEETAKDSANPRVAGPTTQFELSKHFKMQNPVYIIFGFERADTSIRYKNQVKVFLSSKFSLFEYVYDTIIIDKNKKIIKHLNFDFGYQQKCFWNVYDGDLSRPMYDINYSPSFYISWITAIKKFPVAPMVGYIHESNGMSAEISRSWDRVFMGMDFGSLNITPAFFQIVLWVPLGLEENPNIHRYCGIGEINVYWQPLLKIKHTLADFGFSLNYKLASRNINNAELGVYGNPFQFLNKYFKRINPTFYAQLYVGKGENLRDYSQKHTSFRLGLATAY